MVRPDGYKLWRIYVQSVMCLYYSKIVLVNVKGKPFDFMLEESGWQCCVGALFETSGLIHILNLFHPKTLSVSLINVSSFLKILSSHFPSPSLSISLSLSLSLLVSPLSLFISINRSSNMYRVAVTYYSVPVDNVHIIVLCNANCNIY